MTRSSLALLIGAIVSTTYIGSQVAFGASKAQAPILDHVSVNMDATETAWTSIDASGTAHGCQYHFSLSSQPTSHKEVKIKWHQAKQCTGEKALFTTHILHDVPISALTATIDGVSFPSIVIDDYDNNMGGLLAVSQALDSNNVVKAISLGFMPQGVEVY